MGSDFCEGTLFNTVAGGGGQLAASGAGGKLRRFLTGGAFDGGRGRGAAPIGGFRPSSMATQLPLQ